MQRTRPKPAASTPPVASDERVGRNQAAEVSRFVVQVLRTATGRGPTRARATLTPDVVTIVLGDSLTRMEQTLVDHGRGEVVVATRAALVRSRHGELSAGIERITGGRVLSVHFDHRADLDTAVMTFVLDGSCA